jgi:hypothetical protein
VGDHEEFGKSIIEALSELRGARFEAESEVRTAPQRADLFVWPEGPAPPETPPLFARMTEDSCVFELVSRAPSSHELAQIVRKAMNIAHRRAKAKGSRSLLAHAVRVWVLAAGHPRTGLAAFDARPMAGWPDGFFVLRFPISIGVVVIPELPTTPETLWLRLMGGSTVDRALAELKDLSDNSAEYQRLRGPSFRFWKDYGTRRAEVESMRSKQWYEAEVERLHAEGELVGERKVLLKQLTLKFGAVSEGTRQRLVAATAAELDTWAARVLTAGTIDEVFD